MKCLILAGGRGERLWPLSRKNYPKQFIQVENNHSVFQDTIVRNIPYCDEFIIVTSYEYRFIIESQMKVFQGISYRCVYEEIPKRTAAPIMLACMGLPLSETVFVTSSDIVVSANDSYRDALLTAKSYSGDGSIVVFGKEETTFNSRYGYIVGSDDEGHVTKFIEKPESSDDLGESYLRNLGMIVFHVGDFVNEVKKIMPAEFKKYRHAYNMRRYEYGDVIFGSEALEDIEPISIERSVLENTKKLRVVNSSFDWNELTDIADMTAMDYKTTGVTVVNDCENTVAINNTPDRALVVNGLNNAVVVNTEDAVYVGLKDGSSSIKELIKTNDDLKTYVDRGTLTYRQWGTYFTLEQGIGYYIRRVRVLPGKTIYAHRHESRTENWTILRGTALVQIEDKTTRVEEKTNIQILPGTLHQVSNVGEDILEFIDTTFGENLNEEENLPRLVDDLKESDLGVASDPIVKFRPVFKDYLWGGTRLRDEYGMKCDYDKVAEAWVMSAHQAGQSIVATGRHRGMFFGKYIDTVGKDILGWKCSQLKSFPLLAKLIDARDDLSIQVHPDDDYAMQNENQYGKNEMWYVMDADEGAGLYVGFNKNVTPDEVKEAIDNGTITSLLNFYPTTKGDVFFIPSGTVHAIGKGNLICEIQQSSTCTYRLYDFDREDKYGNKRALHLDKALDVMDYSKYEGQSFEGESNVVCRCKYFETLVYDVEESRVLPGDDSKFSFLICIDGNLKVTVRDVTISLKAGESAFVPASSDVINVAGSGKLIISRV